MNYKQQKIDVYIRNTRIGILGACVGFINSLFILYAWQQFFVQSMHNLCTSMFSNKLQCTVNLPTLLKLSSNILRAEDSRSNPVFAVLTKVLIFLTKVSHSNMTSGTLVSFTVNLACRNV